MVQRTRVVDRTVTDAVDWSDGLRLEVAGRGVLGHAGVVLPRMLADRVGLTHGLAAIVARRGFQPLRDRGRLLSDVVAAMIAGASCLSDVEGLTRQTDLYGPAGGASDSTILRALSELAGQIRSNGLPGRRMSRVLATVRAHAWQQIVTARDDGQLPAVRVAGQPLTHLIDGRARPVTVVRVDATIIEAATMKPGVAGHFKGGIGHHPLTAWCSNIGDPLAVMHRPGNAGSGTGIDHVHVLDEALAQLPAPYRKDLLVTIDGAGYSHQVIEHLTSLNTHREHGRRGRQVEYSIGWPIDERTQTGIDELPATAWTTGLGADGKPETDAHVAELTGILRHSLDGDRLDGWPPDLRIIARRTPRPAGQQPKLGEDPDWCFGAFATNTIDGQLQWLDARHRTQAHVEDNIKEWKTLGARRLPTAHDGRNAAWLHLAALAVMVTAWLRHLALDPGLKQAEPKKLRFRILAAPARIIHHARRTILRIGLDWPWADQLTRAWDRLQALHPA